MREKQKKILESFKNPTDSQAPLKYVVQVDRSKYLVRVIKQLFPDRKTKILELGSGTGRNLYFLQEAGYENVQGIEVSPAYIEAMKEHYAKVADNVQLGRIQEYVTSYTVDLVFSMAVLEHIPDSPVFGHIVKAAPFLLIVEDEYRKGWRHYPRNYKQVFEKCGMVQIGAWKFPPLSSKFVMRLFGRNW